MNETARFAIVNNAERAEKLYRYLPANYVILAGIDGQYLIVGVDSAGWTLDGYVIPRLGSGTIQCLEITAEAAVAILAEGPDNRDYMIGQVYDEFLSKLHSSA
jgi:hypothetical protein